MLIPEVSISLANGAIGGAPTTTDGVVGLIGTGADAGGVAKNTPFLVFSLQNAIAQGFTATAEPNIYRHLKEFYDVAPLGSKIYVMAAAKADSMSTLVDKTNLAGAVKLLEFAAGEIKALAIVRTPDVAYVPTTPQFIDSDAIEAMTNGKALVQAYFDKHDPFRLIIGARVHDASNATVFNPSTTDKNGIMLVVGGSLNDGSASVGFHLGRIAATPVHRNIGRIKDGSLPVLNLYIGNKKLKEFAGLADLIEKGFSTFQAYPKKDGFFISDDPMASTDDYRYLCNCRVIDKASIIAYQTYLEELKDEVDLDKNGRIASVDLKHLEAVISNNIMLGMSESISGEPVVFIDPAQNLASGNKLQVKLRLTPKGYLREINVELGFVNPAN